MALFRWIRKTKPKARSGDTREVRRFLWFPTTIGGETRWLGIQRLRETAYMGWECAPGAPAFKTLKWRRTAWVD